MTTLQLVGISAVIMIHAGLTATRSVDRVLAWTASVVFIIGGIWFKL